MALLLEEIKERLVQRYDSLELLELLGVTPEELVEAFEDHITSAVFEELEEELEEFNPE